MNFTINYNLKYFLTYGLKLLGFGFHDKKRKKKTHTQCEE